MQVSREPRFRFLWYSEDFKVEFGKRTATSEASPVQGRRIRDLQFSKIRFSSTQKPVGRFIIFVSAVFGTCIYIARNRKGTVPSEIIFECFDWADEERLLQLGMLADSGDQSNFHLTTFLDTEGYDTCEFPRRIDNFIHQQDYFFLRKNAHKTGRVSDMVIFFPPLLQVLFPVLLPPLGLFLLSSSSWPFSLGFPCGAPAMVPSGCPGPCLAMVGVRIQR